MSALHSGRVLFCRLGGGSSRTGTGVTFLYFHHDRTPCSPPNTFPHASQLYPPPSPRHPYTLAVPVSPGGSCQSSASLRIPLELIVPAVAGGGKRSEAAAGRRWRVRCQSLSLIINFCHSAPWQPRSPALPPFSLSPSLCGSSFPGRVDLVCHLCDGRFNLSLCVTHTQ